MIRSTKHILKYQTNKKNDLLNISIELLQKQIQKYIELICNGNLSLKKLISSKDLKNFSIKCDRYNGSPNDKCTVPKIRSIFLAV